MFLHCPFERLCVQRPLVTYSIYTNPQMGLWRLCHSSLQIHTFAFAYISGFNYMVAAPIKRQQQAYFSSTMSSVTSGAAGWLVRQLCKESDSYTPCHDSDSATYNFKPSNMLACRKLPLPSYSTSKADGAQIWVLLRLFLLILNDQNQGLNEKDGEHKRPQQRE